MHVITLAPSLYKTCKDGVHLIIMLLITQNKLLCNPANQFIYIRVNFNLNNVNVLKLMQYLLLLINKAFSMRLITKYVYLQTLMHLKTLKHQYSSL